MADMVDVPEFDDLESDIMQNARKINSLSGQVSKLTESDVNRVSMAKGEKEIVSTTAKVIKKMGEAVSSMSRGMKTVTVGSLRYTKEALGQYSKALGEDINVDKRNLLSMSLAKSTPIFGYFAAKFMETDVFQKAAQNIKDKMGEAVSFIGDRFKSALTSPFRGMAAWMRNRKDRLPAERLGEEPRTGRRGTFVEQGGQIHFHPIGRSKMTPMKIPKMATGGYVERGGLTRLHPAEVVMPIDKLLDRIDEKIENEADVRMNKMMRGVTIQQMRMMKRYMKTQAEVQTKSFTESYKTQYKSFIEPFNSKMMDAFTDLKTALLGQPNSIMNSLRLMWQRFLSKHPVFLGLLRMGGLLIKTLAWPLQFIFNKRGSRLFRWVASKSSNPLVSTAETLARFAPTALGYYDNILTVLKDSLIVQKDMVSFFTGQTYGPTILKTPKRWSFAGILKNMAMGDVKRVGRWGRKAKSYLFGGGGAEEGMQEEMASPITMSDRLDIMIDLLKDIANSSSKSTRDLTFKDYVRRDGTWQKRSLDVEKSQLNEQKKHRGLYGRMKDSLSFIGLKIKNMAVRIGEVVVKGVGKAVSFVKSTLDTIFGLIPGWMKVGLVVALLPSITNTLGDLFQKKILPVIDKYMSSMALNITDAFKKALRGEKSPEEFKKEETTKKEAIIAQGQIMKKQGSSAGDVAQFVSKKLKEEQIGFSLSERYEKFMGEDIGLFDKVWFKAQQSRAKVRSFFTKGFLDDETSLRNLMEEVNKGKMDPDKAGLLYLSTMEKKMSPIAFTSLVQSGSPASSVDNFRTMMANKMVYNENGIWITQDEFFKKRAGFKDKAVAKVGEFIDNRSFGIFGLQEQFKEASSRTISAKDLADEQDKKYAKYMEDKMTPEAYRILTRDGVVGIADKLNTMMANNQLIDYEGKLNTAYQFLKKTDKLTWKDRFKHMFGLREMSPAEMIDKLGIKSLATREGFEEAYAKYLPFNPYSAISTSDLKKMVMEGGSGAANYVQELMNRLPKEQLSAFMRNPKVVDAMRMSENIMQPFMEKSEFAAKAAQSEFNKQLATIESNKKFQGAVEGMKDIHSGIASMMSNINNSNVNNTTNNVSSQSEPKRDLYPVDLDERDLITGDLK